MMINVAGPFTAPTEEGRRANRERIDRAVAEVLARGHIPIVGAYAAEPLVAHLPEAERYEAMMRISLALVEKCDAMLCLGLSPGVEREPAVVKRLGLPMYETINDVPAA